MKLKPWKIAPYELLKHGEQHRASGGSFDLRMALISFDNAIEVSITTYLSLHPEQRSNIELPREQVEKWKRNYHSKLQFFEEHVTRTLSQSMEVERCDIIHFHTVRNKLYHEGGAFVPHEDDVAGIRAAAVWVFKVLFETDVEALLARESTSVSVDIGNTRRPDPLAMLDEMVLGIRKDVDSLRAALSPQLRSPATNEQIVADVLRTEDPKISNTLQEAFRKAEKIADSLGDGKEPSAEPAKIDEINRLLQELRDRLGVPLRKYQEELAEGAARASIQALEAGRKLIGNVYQPLQSGMSITIAAYLSLITQHSRFRDFTILVVADRSIIAEQYYARIRASPPCSGRTVFHVTPLNLASATSGSSIGVGTIQSLRSYATSKSLPEKTLIVAVGLDVAADSWAETFRDAYRISFSNTLRSIVSAKVPLIAAYSFPQAVQDGFMDPAEWLHVSLPGFGPLGVEGAQVQAIASAGNDASTGRATRVLLEAQVTALAQNILQHLVLSAIDVAKALVIVANVVEAEQFRLVLLQEIGLGHGMRTMRDLKVLVLTSHRTAAEAAHDLREFAAREQEPGILICVKMWAGIDLSMINRVFVTCPLSTEELRNLVERLSGLRRERGPPVVVDYANNPFSHLYS